MLNKGCTQTAPQANAKVAETTQKGFGEQTLMTIDIRDALLAQMRECWNVPVGAPNPEQLIVQVRVFLAPDGSWHSRRYWNRPLSRPRRPIRMCKRPPGGFARQSIGASHTRIARGALCDVA